MNEPDKLHLSDWFAASVAVGLAISGFLYSWLRGRRAIMHKRFEKLETDMTSLNQKMAAQDELIALTESNVKHIESTLRDVKKSTEASTKLLQDLLLKLAK